MDSAFRLEWENSRHRAPSRCFRLLRCSVLWLAFVTAAWAADDEKVFTPGASRTESSASATGAGLSSVSLFLGLALAGAGGWLVWRNRRGAPVARDLRALAIDETRSLGNRQFLIVASYEGKKFLLGVCPGRIDMLTPLDGSPAKEKTRE
jgi:flagellar protein FliO/FliZ